MSLYVGEALVGEGNEIAHIDLMIGAKTGPVGAAFAPSTSWRCSSISQRSVWPASGIWMLSLLSRPPASIRRRKSRPDC